MKINRLFGIYGAIAIGAITFPPVAAALEDVKSNSMYEHHSPSMFSQTASGDSDAKSSSSDRQEHDEHDSHRDLHPHSEELHVDMEIMHPIAIH